MSGLDEPCGIQVVKVKDDHTYKLDEGALKEILLREDVKDLPVVLVSVAGAYRGGKSFLLDFFIKYLSAPESLRNSGQWLGDENEPLSGFRWRGGCDRETTGLHLWSEPIKILYKGQPVVVLLMDTQGTFDSSSTVRDCSTIFALSTLLSSVQIYNLKENIKEDDLQHLHLFVEYGKLAQDQETAFQVLMFLVRDWPYPYQHAYGAVGGEQLLAKRLEINASHTEDMRDLRKSIYTFFNAVKGFLMPHPGFSVSEEKFDGRLFSIRDEFKKSLLDLVPSIFGPENLTPKNINGQPVKCCDLFYYFKTYMNIFNSNELPEPVTIMKATSEAALMAAEREACDMYSRVMEGSCGARQPSVSANQLRSSHAHALDCARKAFDARKKMGPQKEIDDCFARIINDLESRLASYEALNDAKFKSAIANANKAYEDTVQEVCGDAVLCLHPTDLEVLHLKAVTNGTECFDSLHNSSDDEERNAFLERLEGNIKDLRNKNEQNNLGFIMKAQEDYVMYIANSVDVGSFFSESLLNKKHSEAKQHALHSFRSHRNIDNDEPEDPYIEMLEKNIKEHHSKNTLINRNANRTAVQAAQHAYNNHVARMWSPEVYCLHPDDLCKVNQDAKNAALEDFMSNRIAGDDDDEDPDRKKLIEVRSFSPLQVITY
ncbi:hypothetical protein O3G_MSEX004742 [Manduca sexta]|uniref:GB1/RHD3-type G domain-containing protein n=1 Tax=Manduca sexta TaxID=7130 RepID=A0A921YY35_MANSE|nr:hypothetical protein O3G_MSEX004742 [Manduca sexta]